MHKFCFVLSSWCAERKISIAQMSYAIPQISVRITQLFEVT